MGLEMITDECVNDKSGNNDSKNVQVCGHWSPEDDLSTDKLLSKYVKKKSAIRSLFNSPERKQKKAKKRLTNMYERIEKEIYGNIQSNEPGGLYAQLINKGEELKKLKSDDELAKEKIEKIRAQKDNNGKDLYDLELTIHNNRNNDRTIINCHDEFKKINSDIKIKKSLLDKMDYIINDLDHIGYSNNNNGINNHVEKLEKIFSELNKCYGL